MEIIKDTILADVINNKKYEIELELDFYLTFLDRDKNTVEETISEFKDNPYFYREHSEFLDNFEKFGEFNFIREYMNFCNNYYSNKKLSLDELSKVANDENVKAKFRSYLEKNTSKQLKKLKKCFIEFCEDESYFKLQRKMTEMIKIKKDIEYDIYDLITKMNPKIFPDLEDRVNKYKKIAADNKLFF